MKTTKEPRELRVLPLSKQAYFYFSWKGDRARNRFAPAPHPRFFEFHKLKYFAREFKLNKLELEQCDPIWVDEMYQIGIGYEEAKSDAEKAASDSSVGSGKAFAGKTVRTKIL